MGFMVIVKFYPYIFTSLLLFTEPVAPGDPTVKIKEEVFDYDSLENEENNFGE